MQHVVGIDLGTTYSTIAVVNEFGKPEIVSNREGELITPSVVFFNDDGSTLVGSMAKHAASQAPDSVQQFVKRRMGERQTWPAPNGEEFTPEALSALILKRLKEDAELTLGDGSIRDAVVTVPAYFDDGQRRATVHAGEIAGLNVLGVLNEPTAAALAYGLSEIEAGTILVFDLGGGTFDVTVMKIGADQGSHSFDVLATGGDRNLGGFNWDNELMTLLNARFQEAGGSSLTENASLEAGLREKTELAKRSLTTVAKANVVLSDGTVTKTIAITRDEFEAATAGLLSRAKTIAELTLEDAKLEWADIETVVLVGGSTRMPAVRALLEEQTSSVLMQRINADEAVALGAAISAAHLATPEEPRRIGPGDGEAGARYLPNLSISDVTSQALGVIVVEMPSRRRVNAIVIPRNTKIPSQESDTFLTVENGQTQVLVEVTQGDDTDPEYVTVVGQQVFTIPSYPAEAPFDLIYSYDVDQMIHIEVVDGTSKRSLGSFEVHNKANLNEDALSAAQSLVSRTEVA